MSSPRVWFITGASSGFGYHLACFALGQGDKVVATMRNTESGGQQLRSQFANHIADGSLLILPLDVKSSQAISQAFETTRERYGRIDVVFNNAGYAIIGEFEGTPEESAREMFDTNFWGAGNVTKESIKAFRENSPPGGRLLQNSSVAAVDGGPGTSYYGASKAALESITESLTLELDLAWNIKITIIQPGPFNTKALGDNKVVFSSPSAYSPHLGAGVTKAALDKGDVIKQSADPVKGAKLFYRLSTLENPPARLPLHPAALLVSKNKSERVQRDVEEYKSWSEEVF